MESLYIILGGLSFLILSLLFFYIMEKNQTYNKERLHKKVKENCNHCSGTGKCCCGKNVKLPDMTKIPRLIEEGKKFVNCSGPGYETTAISKGIYEMRSAQEIMGKFCLGNFCIACDGKGYHLVETYEDVIKNKEE